MDEQQKSLIDELRRFTTCELADGLGASCAIETAIRPVDTQFRICGPALTVECAPGDNLTLHHALHVAQPGDVLVVASSESGDVALWGELMSISAQSKRLAGTIVDGAVRDPLQIRSIGYPVFCRDVTPRRAAKQSYGRIHVPIRIGTIRIHPGDIVLADANGIASIPPECVAEAIHLASEVVRKEKKIKNEILSGRSIFEIFQLEQFVTDRQPPAE